MKRRTVEMETSFFDPLKTYFSMGCDCYPKNQLDPQEDTET